MEKKHPVSPESVGVSSPNLDKVHAVLQKCVDERKAPGLVVLIAKNGKIIYQEATGKRDVAAGAPYCILVIANLRPWSEMLAIVTVAYTEIAIVKDKRVVAGLCECLGIIWHDDFARVAPAAGQYDGRLAPAPPRRRTASH